MEKRKGDEKNPYIQYRQAKKGSEPRNENDELWIKEEKGLGYFKRRAK